MMPSGLLKSILGKRSGMDTAEQRVADFVSTHPEQIMQMSMAALSRKSSVSDPTSMRFCRRLGFEGYAMRRIGQAV